VKTRQLNLNAQLSEKQKAASDLKNAAKSLIHKKPGRPTSVSAKAAALISTATVF
jgi:hypothetical protein